MRFAAHLSPLATAWLDSLGATETRAPYTSSELRRALAPNGLDWEPIVRLEARFGGLGGCGGDGRELYVGADGHPGTPLGPPLRPDARFTRPHLAVGYYDPILWFSDETGRIVEVDDLGHTFYESDDIGKRLEQLALENVAATRHVLRLDGFHGRALAEALGLVVLPEPSDSRQRYWATAGLDGAKEDAIVVRESLEPEAYASARLARSTWLYAGTSELLSRARTASAEVP